MHTSQFQQWNPAVCHWGQSQWSRSDWGPQNPNTECWPHLPEGPGTADWSSTAAAAGPSLSSSSSFGTGGAGCRPDPRSGSDHSQTNPLVFLCSGAPPDTGWPSEGLGCLRTSMVLKSRAGDVPAPSACCHRTQWAVGLWASMSSEWDAPVRSRVWVRTGQWCTPPGHCGHCQLETQNVSRKWWPPLWGEHPASLPAPPGPPVKKLSKMLFQSKTMFPEMAKPMGNKCYKKHIQI